MISLKETDKGKIQDGSLVIQVSTLESMGTYWFWEELDQPPHQGIRLR